MDCYGISDVGVKRSENQDTFAIKTEYNCTVAVVCDGMGGAAGGKIASEMGASLFVDSFFQYFAEFCANKASTVASVGIPRAIKNAVKTANKEIYERSKENKKLAGMGTTLVGAVFFEDTCYAVNVGDSRMYQLDSDKNLSQVTKDHTYLEFLIENGKKITKRMEKHEKGVITRALGPDQKVVPDVYVFDASDGEVYLLCSDGLYNMIGNDGIEKGLLQYDSKPIADICNELVNNANLEGGKDNITAVIIKL